MSRRQPGTAAVATPAEASAAEPVEKNPAAVFILSPPRSGSTLLRVMLGGHSHLFAPPELELLNYRTMHQRREALGGRNRFRREGLVRAVMELLGCEAAEAHERVAEMEGQAWTTHSCYRQLQQWLGEGHVLVDKTPSYALDGEALQSAEREFEGARYLHLVRHPGAVVRSFEEARLDEVFFEYEHGYGAGELAEMVWAVSQQNILEFLGGVEESRQLRVVFEELVREPERGLRRVCQWLGVEYEERMADPYGDGRGRMTDGLYGASRMLGDVKYHGHKRVDETVAEGWRKPGAAASRRKLGEETWRVARLLGFHRENEGNGRSEPEGRELTTILPVSSDTSAEQILANLDQLSDDEVSSLLGSALAEREFNE